MITERQAPPNNDSSQSDESVARTILAQLGGNHFLMVTGTRNLLAADNALTMQLATNALSATHLVISLNGRDLYDLQYLQCSPADVRYPAQASQCTTLATYTDQFADMLIPNFESATGLFAHL